jgi:hypothetical protein
MVARMKVVVFHAEYGCDTGCCGHVVRMGDEEEFRFKHPYGADPRAFAEELVREEFGEEHVADLDWDNCHIGH